MFLFLLAGNVLALSVPAREAQFKDVGGPADKDGWCLWSNGRIDVFLELAKAGEYQLRVRARGSSCEGVWPVMDFAAGSGGGQVSVTNKDYADYAFKFQAEAGLCRITLAFNNDALTKTEDRNLYVERLEILPPAGAPEPVLVDRSEKMEQELIAKTVPAIERFRKASVTVRVLDANGRPVQGAAVTVEQIRHDFLFGCNIYGFDTLKTPELNETYKQRFAQLFNYATTGFYWRHYEEKRGQPDYPYTDKVIAWCAERHIRLKGHPLLWNHEAGIPTWSNGQPPADVQKSRVTEIMRRFAGKIEFWEVVNEPAHTGFDIAAPYRWAREADPKATLIVNDYRILADGCPAFYALLDKAKRDGVPFDGIGIQAHEPLGMRFPLYLVNGYLDMYAKLGVPLHLTEFTPCSTGTILGSKQNWDDATQADFAQQFYRICFAHPAVVAITWWDLCDAASWQQGGGLLRADGSAKPAYDVLKKLIHEEWKTRVQGKTDVNGAIVFRGFLGVYRVKEGDVEKEFSIKKDAENVVTLRRK